MEQLDQTVQPDIPPIFDARREPRFGCDKAIEIVPCEGFGAGALQTVRMIDRSSRGFGLVAAQSMRPGSQFVAKVDAEPPHRLYTVRHCRATGQGTYRVGAELAGVDR